MQCLLYREGLLRKMRFPRLVIPLAVALTALFNLGMNLIVVLIFALASGVDPRLSWLEMPVLIALLAALAVGIGMLLSVLYVRFRDIQPIWDVTAQILFYASPIIYTAKTYPASVVRIAMLNPIAMITTQIRTTPSSIPPPTRRRAWRAERRGCSSRWGSSCSWWRSARACSRARHPGSRRTCEPLGRPRARAKRGLSAAGRGGSAQRQLAETEAWANRTVVAAQEKTYWLDRWGVDLNALMARPAADRARALARSLRSLYRVALRWRRRITS